jgi:hypothetical protein
MACGLPWNRSATVGPAVHRWVIAALEMPAYRQRITLHPWRYRVDHALAPCSGRCV